MAEFEVDFSESLNQLAQFQLRIANLGASLDKIEQNSGKATSASAKLLKETSNEFDKLEKMLAAVGVDAEKIGGIMQRVRTDTANMLSGVAASNLKATTAARAYNGELAELGRLMSDTASKQNFVRTQQQLASLSERLANENKVLTASISALDTEEGKLNATLKEQLNAKRNALKVKKEELTADQRTEKQALELRTALEQLNSEQAQENVLIQQLISSRKAEIAENQRLDAKLQQLERTMRSLNGGTAEQIAQAEVLVRARRDQVTEDQRAVAQLERLQREYASLNGGIGEQIVRQQQLINARKAQITTTDQVVRKESEAEKSITAEQQALNRLRAQLELMSGPRGAEITALRRQILEQERYNKLAQMSTAQLFGLGRGHEQLRLTQMAGNQAAAALRAGLQGLRASVGMYTSGTILAATAVYGFTAALRDSVVTGAQFSASMSRTNAVMSTNGLKWLDTGTTQAQALETQVRALGQTTVFTASEVSQGLFQLGAAGFSASDAITALPATLQLANIANVNMAQSADIATNVLSTFGKEAKDLQGVVDLMATAVNNSNTDITELANALSYVGPAAQTAGVSLEDTVAAIETLANSGIKASRAGSGLRRFLVSLVNPTKKGQEVLDRYGISVTDAAGNTRSLTDIVGQLGRALNGLPGGERLAAIQNLVGVYAAAPVAALINNGEKFNAFRSQNDPNEVKGAGKAMEKLISDNLQFDWKELLSAVEELQLQAFDSLKGNLREAVAQLSVWVLDAMKPVNTVFDEAGNKKFDITGLDRLIQDATTAAQAIGTIGAAYVGLRLANTGGSLFIGLSQGAASLSEKLAVTSNRVNEHTAAQLTQARALAAATGGMRAQTAEAIIAAPALNAMSGAAATAATTLSRIAAVAGTVVRAFGWVGLIYGIGSALYDVFSSSTDEKIIDHKNNVDSVKDSYTRLKEQIEASGLAKQRAALELQKTSDQAGIGKVNERITSRQAIVDAARAAGATDEQLQPTIDEIKGLQEQVGIFENNIKNTDQSLANLGITTNDYASAQDLQAQRLVELTRLTNEMTLAQNNLNAAMQVGTLTGDPAAGRLAIENAQRALDQARVVRDAQSESTTNGPKNLSATLGAVQPLQQTFDQQALEVGIAAEEAAYKKTTPAAQKLLDLQTKITKEYEAREALVKRDQDAIDSGNLGNRPGTDEVERSNNKLSGLLAEQAKLQKTVNADQEKLAKAQEDAARVQRSDAENLTELTKQRADLEQQINQAKAQGIEKTDPARLTKLYTQQRDVLQQIKGLEKKDSKADDKADKEAARQLKEAQTQYDSLAKKFDAVTYAQRELEKGTKAMNLLRANGKITADQENKALGELNLNYYKAVQGLDANYVALQKLKDTYLNDSPFGTAAADLGLLNRNLLDSKVNLQEYALIYGQIQKKQRDQVLSGLPEANISPGDFSGSVFTDFIGKIDEQAKGSKQYSDRSKELEASIQQQTVANDRNRELQMAALEEKKLNETNNAAELLKIEQEYQDTKSGIQATAEEQRNALSRKSAEFQAQMGQLVMAGVLGTAQNILAQFASADKEASGAQKAAFAIQKALAVAQIIIYTEVAAARAGAELGFAGIPLATYIRATGYANAGLVAAIAIGQLAGGGQSGSSSGGSTPMYDTGGYIPYNKVGIVGEYGPELVRGPASVTGRTATANKMGGSGGGGDLHITIAPVTTITGSQGGDQSSATQDAKTVANTVNMLVEEKTREMIRPGGILYEWERNK